MLHYNLGEGVEAFSTNIPDAIDFPVVLPAHQAHTAFVRRVPQQMDDIIGVDALITNERGLRIGVKTADCVPILLYDACHKAVAAIHSGWKGTVQNIISATITRMKAEFSTDPADIRAVIGPCIHVDAFEVGDEVYDKFAAMPELKECGVPAKRMPLMSCSNAKVVHSLSATGYGSESFSESGLKPEPGLKKSEPESKWHIDLPAVCRIELLSSGVNPENIEIRPECTWTLHDQFFSARRLGKQFDRQRIINTIQLI